MIKTATSYSHPCDVVQVEKVEKAGETLTVSLAANTDQGVASVIPDVNCLLWAIGRDANLVDLEIDKTGQWSSPSSTASSIN